MDINKEKLISVIIPCYNVEKYVERCFRSLEQQTIGIHNLEIIFVQDGSTDNTAEVLNTLEREYPDSILIIHNSYNTKPGAARNLGLSYASAPYIMFIDSDDWVDERYCEVLFNLATKHRCDMVACNVYRDYGDGRKLRGRDRSEGTERILDLSEDKIFRKSLVMDYIGNYAYAKIMKREVLIQESILFPEGIFFEDIAWTSHCYIGFSKICLAPDYLYHYFVNTNSIVLRKNQDYYEDMFVTNELKWMEWKKRGILDKYPEETAYDFIISYYLGILKMFSVHYDRMPLEAFNRLQVFIKNNVSEYKDNFYVKTHLPEQRKMLLGFIDTRIEQQELDLIMESIRNNQIL